MMSTGYESLNVNANYLKYRWAKVDKHSCGCRCLAHKHVTMKAHRAKGLPLTEFLEVSFGHLRTLLIARYWLVCFFLCLAVRHEGLLRAGLQSKGQVKSCQI